MTSVLNSEDNDIENSNSNNQNQSTPPVSPTSTSPSVSTSNTLLLCSSNNDNKRETITLPSSFKFIKKHGKICIYDSETKISKPDQVNCKNHKDEKDIDNATSIWVAKTDNLNICNDNYHTNLVHDYHINPCATWHLNSISNDKIKSKFDKDLVIKHQSQEKNSDELEDEEFDNNNEVRVEEDIYCTVEDIGENSNSTIFNVKSDTLKINSHYIKKHCNNFSENECITFLLTTGLIAKNSFHKLMQEKKESEATRKEHEQDLQYGMGIWDGRLEYKNQLVKIYG
ncbi:12745_t:CDS:2 [Entrophospora sp. SA101]|nr:12135_t:CDS:2 [Entrophospora sp. SA101]CAJ0826940.1 19546_t:CDS:2 [Entrophospora sp. SA101]CAJ0864484.1 12745_t:CDS:2 [Entrophospora sp. SA101]